MEQALARWASRAWVTVFYIVLLAPIVVVLPVSLNTEAILGLPRDGLSLQWYAALATDPRIGQAFGASLRLAVVVTVLSIAIALPAALALSRLPSRIDGPLIAFFTLPLMLPAVVLGLGLMLVLVQVGLLATFTGLVVAHLIVVTPYVIRLLTSAEQTKPPDLEAVAASLGAGPWRILVTVTLPLLSRALLSAAALAFLTSFDEAVLSLFLSGPDIATLPVVMFEYAKSRGDPTIAALSVVLLAVAFALILLVERVAGLAPNQNNR